MEKTKIIKWIKQNQLEFWLIAGIVLLSLFLRLYRINEFLTFLGDEGRDVRIVRDLITKGNLVFIGPQTSIGNMYLGPLYYYMMAPALLISWLNPVGPAVMVALIGTLTVFLTWIIGRHWFGRVAGLTSALFFALSPVAIIYSRSSWNPNPMPLFALLSVWFIYRLYAKNHFLSIIFAAISFSAALQMHYLGLLLSPVLALYFILTFLKVKKDSEKLKSLLKNTVIAIFVFLLSMSPLALFDLKHQGMNFNAFKTFFTNRQTTVNLNPARSDRFLPVISQATTDLVTARQEIYSLLVFVILLVLFILSLTQVKNKKPHLLLLAWLFTGFLGLGVYKQHVYIHYLGFIYPAFFLLTGVSLSYLLRSNLIFKILGASAILFIVFLNLKFSPTFQNPNRQLQRTEAAVDLIIKESKGNHFNFGLIAKQNYDESYRYFLENKKANLVRGEEKVVDQLFVICEDGDSCKPEGHPQWQIAVFGIAKIDQMWQIDHLKIYRLVHPQK